MYFTSEQKVKKKHLSQNACNPEGICENWFYEDLYRLLGLLVVPKGCAVCLSSKLIPSTQRCCGEMGAVHPSALIWVPFFQREREPTPITGAHGRASTGRTPAESRKSGVGRPQHVLQCHGRPHLSLQAQFTHCFYLHFFLPFTVDSRHVGCTLATVVLMLKMLCLLCCV